MKYANNSVNYARWHPNHLRDMLLLDHTHPQMSVEFIYITKNVLFTNLIENCKRWVLTNYISKQMLLSNGAISVTEEPFALRRWLTLVAGPECKRSMH